MDRLFTGLWRHQDFLKLWAGQSVSLLGSYIGRTVLPLLVILMLDASPLQISLLRTVELVPGMVIGLLAGVWVDRLRRLPLMVAADFGRAAVLATIPLAFLVGSVTMAHILAVAFAVSVLTVLFDVAYQSYLPTLVDKGSLVEANSKLEASSSVAEIAGFGTAGALVQLITAPLAIWVDALSFVVSALSLMLIRQREPAPAPASPNSSAWREVREGLAALQGSPLLRTILGASGIGTMFGNIIGVVIMLFCLRELNLSPAVTTATFALGGVSALVGAMLAAPTVRRFGFGRTVVGTQLFGLSGMLCIALAGGPMWLAIALLVAAQLISDGPAIIYEISMTSLRQAITPDHLLGRVSAAMRVSDWGFTLAGTLLGGVLGETVGLRGALFVAAGGKVLQLLWLYFSPIRPMHEQPAAG